MYAVVRTGGKQYRVEPGDTIQVEKLLKDAGEKLELKEVLLLADGDGVSLGRPLLEGATVSAEVLGTDRGRKVVVYKYRRRKRYRRKAGHRQWLTTLHITGIQAPGLAQAPADGAPSSGDDTDQAEE